MSTDTTVGQIIEQEKRRGRALIARDASALDALLADDLLHIHSTGKTNNKSQLIHHAMHVLQFLDVQRGDLEVTLHGDVAIMTGRMSTRMRRFDKPEPTSAESWVTQVWVRRGAAWVQTHFQATRAAASETSP